MCKNITWVLLLLVMPHLSGITSAQERQVYGTIFETIMAEKIPMPGVVVKIPGYDIGTQTDEDGNYRLTVPDGAARVVFEKGGYITDTVQLKEGPNNIAHVMKAVKQLNEVEVTYRRKGNEMNLLDTRKTELISERELLKAACCNLSESFETTPSVDVAFTDAVSGYKQIQMLGLAGPYTVITRENIPDVRGLSAVTGLTFTPGTWIEGMQLSKGTGSVVNGYESVAGQINVELRKPFEEKEPKAHINLYQANQGRSEANFIYNHRFNKQLSSNIMLHGSSRWRRVDMNKDGFMDQPLNTQFSGLNRWFFFGPKGWEVQGGVKAVYMDQEGGSLAYRTGTEQVPGNPWGFKMGTKRIEGWAKIGKVFPERPTLSTGLQLSGLHHEQNALYGTRVYNATQNTVYANWIWQTIIKNTNHGLKAGLSSIIDNYNEQFEAKTFARNEVVPGIFAEYSYNYLAKFNVILGLRGDYHNIFGAFVTPRLHLRYAPWERTALRGSIGRAQRTANILAENIGYMASSRSFVFQGTDPSLPYGFKPEVAWNMGANLTQKFRLNYRDGAASIDYYYTEFKNQVIVDVEDPHTVRFYNLKGVSVANSLQGQLDYEPVLNLDVRLAYRWYDVKTTYGGILKQRPLVANHRAFINVGYETRNTWRFDYTLQWVGTKRLPSLHDHHTGLPTGETRSPSYFQMNAQVSKTWNEVFEIYLGGENLTNYMQHNPILGADNPYASGFDASMVWGPVMGLNVYGGIRWQLQ